MCPRCAATIMYRLLICCTLLHCICRKELMRTGQLPWNITLKLLQGWYVCLSTLWTTFQIHLVFCFSFNASYLTLQVMLYVDMEVNGIPLKVEMIRKRVSCAHVPLYHFFPCILGWLTSTWFYTCGNYTLGLSLRNA